MSRFGLRLSRPVCGGLLILGLLVGPVAVQAAPGPDTAAPTWAVTLDRATLYSAPRGNAVAFGDIDSLVTLQVLGYQGDWAHVYNPRSRTEAYVSSALLGPTDPPSRYVTMSPPPLTDEFSSRGVVTDDSELAVYPSPADEA